MSFVQPEKKAQNNVKYVNRVWWENSTANVNCLTSDGWCIPVYKKISSLDFFDLNVKFIF